MRLRSALFGSACLLAAFTGCDPKPKEKAEPEPAVVPLKQAETLDPDDIGVGKFVFEVKVPATKVPVLRKSEQENGGKKTDVLESIQFTNGGVGRHMVLMFDSSKFPFGERGRDHVRIKAQGASNSFSKHSCTGQSIRPGRLTLTLSHPDGVTVLTYECFLEDYASTKKRVPDLPDATPHETWTFNHSPKGE